MNKVTSFLFLTFLIIWGAFFIVGSNQYAKISNFSQTQTANVVQYETLKLGVNKRYCTGENSEIFNGRVKHDQNGSPYITVTVDPAFASKMHRERGTPESLPLTPIYDLSIKISPDINDYCIPQWDENDNLVGPLLPPETFPYKVALMLEGEEIASSYQLKRVDQEYGTNWGEYEWKIKGWPNGIAPNDKLEKLIEKIKQKGASADIKVVVNPAEPDVTKRDQTGASFELCAPVAGSGKHKIFYERGKNTQLMMRSLKAITDDFIKNSFEQTDPYKKYKSEFAHILDLAYLDDDYIATFGRLGVYPDTGIMNLLIEGSSCNTSKNEQESTYKDTYSTYAILSDLSEVTVKGDGIRGIASVGDEKKVFIVNPFLVQELSHPNGTVEETMLHEFSHTFAGLLDEDDDDGAKVSNKTHFFIAEANCSFVPNLEWGSYADKGVSVEGCSHFRLVNKLTKINDVERTESAIIYRPSPSSLMNYYKNGRRDKRLNAISCGFAVATIKGGEGKDYWEECMGLDVVKPRKDVALESSSLSASVVLANPEKKNNIDKISDTVFDQPSFLIFESAENGVVWMDGQPMPSSIKINPKVSSKKTSISFTSYPLIPPQTIPLGTPSPLGGFTATLQGGPVIVSNLRFRVNIIGKGVSIADLSNINLYNSTGTLISSNALYTDNQIIFKNSFTISTSTSYVIKAVLGSRFKPNQTITLSANFYKDDVVIKNVNTKKELPAPRTNLTLSTMTVVVPPPTVTPPPPAPPVITPPPVVVVPPPAVVVVTPPPLNTTVTTPPVTTPKVTINQWSVSSPHSGTNALATLSSGTVFSTINYGINFQGGPTDGDKRVFVHFVDSNGVIRFYSDILPNTPSSKWTSGSNNWVTIETEVPSDIPTGVYTVYAGLYDNNRVSLNPASGVTADNQTRYKVGTVTITPAPVTSKKSSSLIGSVLGAIASLFGW